MDHWMFEEHSLDIIQKIMDWLEKPPHSFKFTDSFDTNLDNLVRVWGVTLHHELTNGQMMAKRCLLFEEIDKQKKAIAQEAIEREEKLKEESLKKLPAAVKKKTLTSLQKKQKEKPKDNERINHIEFKFTKVDVLTLATIMAAASDKAMPDMIKFWNCYLSDNFIKALDKLLERPSTFFINQDNVINKFFFYINPLENPNIWTPLTQADRKLQMLTLSNCGLSLEAARGLLNNIDSNHHDLIYLDLYGNSLGDQIVPMVTDVIDRYDLLECIGLGNNDLRDHSLIKAMLDRVGRKEATGAELAKYHDRVKERNLLMEKNKKLRTLKKPEEFLFHIDSLIVNDETKSSRY